MCINMTRRSRPSSASKLMSTTRSSYNSYLQPGAGANRRIKNPIFKITINIIRNLLKKVPFPSICWTSSLLYKSLSSLSSKLKPLMFVISSTSDKSSFSSYILLQMERWTKWTHDEDEDEDNLSHSVIGYEISRCAGGCYIILTHVKFHD